MAVNTTCAVCGEHTVASAREYSSARCSKCKKAANKAAGIKEWEDLTLEEKVENLHQRLQSKEWDGLIG